jgi:ABC-type branched-subunit amino acid transport system substrate-binding protein
MLKTTTYSGAMGSFGFDANGDTTLKIITVYKWNPDTGKSDYADQVTVK